MQRIVVVAARGPVYRKLVVAGAMVATRQFIARKALEAGLPAVYLTLTGTEADAERIADAIRQRVS